jgi:ATP-binding cassette subfamily F protein 3
MAVGPRSNSPSNSQANSNSNSGSSSTNVSSSANSKNLLQMKGGVRAFGIRELFSDASFSVNSAEKVGVIGPNGAGKSTLFRILVGQDSLDAGDITTAKGLRIGYLAQDDAKTGELWPNEMHVEDCLASQTSTPMWDVKRLAPKFGLKLEHFARPIGELSGGYRMRVKLLHLLASQPDLMLLDEPTNYLDLETLVVLENFLIEAKCAFLLISHDREFLRRVTDHVLEIEAGQMTKYAGNIDDYFEQKELLRTQLEKAALNSQAKRKEVLDFAARFGAKATKAKQVQSRLKSLDKMEIIEVRALPIKARIRMPDPEKTGKMVIKTEGAKLGYGKKVILRDLRLELQRGDHLGVVGVNGAGKSTLLKTLAGELTPIEGEIEFGVGVKIGYFAQHVAEKLDPEDTVFTAMGAFASPETSRQEILDLAGCLLFSGDDVTKKIRVLSGGEKSRVALGQILLKRAPCLLLDEPTNHLDFDTVEALTQALAGYPGSVVIVSHDRGFVRRAASKILEIRDGRAEFYPGTYDEYVWSVQKGALAEREIDALEDDTREEADSSRKTAPVSDAGDVKFNFKEARKRIERDMRSCEKEMSTSDTKSEQLRGKVLELNEALLSATGPKAAELARELGQAQGEIDRLESLYLEMLEKHEALIKELEALTAQGRN